MGACAVIIFHVFGLLRVFGAKRDAPVVWETGASSIDLESAEQGAGSLAFRGLPLLAMPVPQGGDEARPVQLSMAEFLALKSTPRDAPLYAQGYLVERQTLQPQRPPLPGDEDLQQFCWDYHQGRLLTWNIAAPGCPKKSAGMPCVAFSSTVDSSRRVIDSWLKRRADPRRTMTDSMESWGVSPSE